MFMEWQHQNSMEGEQSVSTELKQQIRAKLDQLGEKGELKNFHAKWFDDPGWLALMP